MAEQTKVKKKKRVKYKEEFILKILKEANNSMVSAAQTCRKYDVHIQTYYQWKKKYGHLIKNGTSNKIIDEKKVEQISNMELSGYSFCSSEVGMGKKEVKHNLELSNAKILKIDFREFPYILTEMKEIAKLKIRNIEHQILYTLKTYIDSFK